MLVAVNLLGGGRPFEAQGELEAATTQARSPQEHSHEWLCHR